MVDGDNAQPEGWLQRVTRWGTSLTTRWLAVGTVITAMLTQVQAVQDAWHKLFQPDALPEVALSDVRAMTPRIACAALFNNPVEIHTPIVFSVDMRVTKKGSAALVCRTEFLSSDDQSPKPSSRADEGSERKLTKVDIGRGDRQQSVTSEFEVLASNYPRQGKVRLNCDNVITAWISVPMVPYQRDAYLTAGDIILDQAGRDSGKRLCN